MHIRCFFDCDGCLADFESSALKLMGVTKEQLYISLPPGRAASYITSPFMMDDDFWGLVDRTPDFWETIPKTKEADEILSVCKKHFGNEVYLLTKPPRNPLAYAGKAKWVCEHFPKMYRYLFVGPKKYAFAHPGSVLVDDNEENCDLFMNPPNNKPGGTAVILPRRGNKLYHLEGQLITYLDDELRKLRG